MKQLPDLSKLSHEQKDQLIYLLWEQVQTLTDKVKDLEDRLSKNSSNSSNPPSQDGFNKPSPRSQRGKNKKKRKVGGQPGHPGKTLKQIETPHLLVEHDPTSCWLCYRSLSGSDRLNFESRQVFDLPPLELEVTEHRAYKKTCSHCSTQTVGDFPEEVKCAAQYGQKIKGLMVYMNQYQLLPFDRTREFFSDLFNQSISVGTIKKAIEISASQLMLAEDHIKKRLINGKVLHADETGLMVKKQHYWLHVYSTSRLTYYAAHAKRGKVGMDEINFLPIFKGTLVHDHLKSYFNYGSYHSLCNAHHLRELTFVQERYQHIWAKKMEKLLLKIKRSVESHQDRYDGPLPEKRLKGYYTQYMNILSEGKKECPRNDGSDAPKRAGRLKQSVARNLLDRLREYRREVLAFMYDPDIPFDNNQAERDIRMMKVQQKISGCFRTVKGIENFCRIRGYLSTAKKQMVSVMDALEKLMRKSPIMFNA